LLYFAPAIIDAAADFRFADIADEITPFLSPPLFLSLRFEMPTLRHRLAIDTFIYAAAFWPRC